jgi:hypothetical protein
MFQSALEGHKKAIGPERIATYLPAITATQELGAVFLLQGNTFQAREMYSAAVAGYEKVLGHQHAHCQHLRKWLSCLDDSKDSTSTSISE